jgi:hypothetical protein
MKQEKTIVFRKFLHDHSLTNPMFNMFASLKRQSMIFRALTLQASTLKKYWF